VKETLFVLVACKCMLGKCAKGTLLLNDAHFYLTFSSARLKCLFAGLHFFHDETLYYDYRMQLLERCFSACYFSALPACSQEQIQKFLTG